MSAKRKAVLDRIEWLEDAIRRSREFLETGRHADWPPFRPLFVHKLRHGREMPPHKDWVKNVFLRRAEKALARAEKLLQHLNEGEHVRTRERRSVRRTGRPGGSW